MTTKTTRNIIPATPIKSQSINQNQKAEFTLEYSTGIFLKRLLPMASKLPSSHEASLALADFLWSLHPKLQKRGQFRDMHGVPVRLGRIVEPCHERFKFLVDSNYQQFGQSMSLFEQGRSGRSALGDQNTAYRRMRVEEETLTSRIQGAIDDAFYEERMLGNDDVSVQMDEEELKARYPREDATVFLPYALAQVITDGSRTNLHRLMEGLVTEKKKQDPVTGEVTRTRVLKKQVAVCLNKTQQKKLLKIVKDFLAPYEAMWEVANEMQDFRRDLFKTLLPFRTTKQLQEGWPELFDDFCRLTGLGVTHGQDLIESVTVKDELMAVINAAK